jgi:hypothetical protein
VQFAAGSRLMLDDTFSVVDNAYPVFPCRIPELSRSLLPM